MLLFERSNDAWCWHCILKDSSENEIYLFFTNSFINEIYVEKSYVFLVWIEKKNYIVKKKIEKNEGFDKKLIWK
jgi:hypothetical protein